MLDLGYVKPGEKVRFPFSSFDSNDPSASAAVTGLAVADILVYKDGGTTERASTSGYVVAASFDTRDGLNHIEIDLADNTTAGFFVAGSEYMVAVGDITIDAATIRFWAGRFRIGYDAAIINTTIATLSSQTSFTLTDGPAEADALVGCPVVIHDVASKVQLGFAVISAYAVTTKTVTLAAGVSFTAAAGDNISIFQPTNSRWFGSVLTSSVLGTIATAAATGDPDSSSTIFGYIKQLVNILIGTAGIATFPAEAAPGNAVSLAEVIRAIHADVTGLNGDAMRGTDSAALASVATEARLAELDAANLPTDIANVQADTDDIQTRLPAALVGGRMDSDIGAKTGNVALSAQEKLDVNAEVDNALDTAIPGVPTANSINERVAAIDDLTQAGGGGDLAAVLADTADMQPKLGTPAGASVSADIAVIQADTDDIQTRLPAALVGGRMDATVDATGMESGAINAILTTAMTEAYAAAGATMTIAQFAYMVRSALNNFANSGTTQTRKKIDGSTTANTLTLDDATNPTSLTEAT